MENQKNSSSFRFKTRFLIENHCSSDQDLRLFLQLFRQFHIQILVECQFFSLVKSSVFSFLVP